jgi:hypothetical protein
VGFHGAGLGSLGSESNQPFRRWLSRWRYNRVLQPSPIFGQTNPTVVEHCQIHTHYIPLWISSGRLVLYSTLPHFSSLKAQVWINSNIQPKQQINKWFTITPYVSTNHHNYSTSQTKSRTTSIPHDLSWHRTVASFI